jgi:hypothetical protein
MPTPLANVSTDSFVVPAKSRALQDLTGRQFGYLRVIRRFGISKSNKVTWLCGCECGDTCVAAGNNLRYGHQTSCGCRTKNKLRNLQGKRFGRWTALSKVNHRKSSGRRQTLVYWVCRCDCGATKEVRSSALIRGDSRSCGCLKTDTDRWRLLHDYTGEIIGRLTVLFQTEPTFKTHRDGTKTNIRARMWRAKCECGKEITVQTQALRKQKASGTGSCGCWAKELRQREREKKTLPYEHYIARIKNSARGRNKEVQIAYADLITLIPENGLGVCVYCGEPVLWLPYDNTRAHSWGYKSRATGHNLDRMDNDGPYSLENVTICCGNCNRTRGDRFTYDEFMRLAPTIRAIREERLLAEVLS